MRRLALLLHLAAATLGAALVARHDGGVALGSERWTGPLAVAAVHLAVGALARALARWRWTRGLPLLTGVAGVSFWAAGLAAPVRVPPAPVAPAPGRAVVVLVTLDTLRADHAGPAFAALAARGVRYTQAVATAPLTAPSHASMLTGLETPDHGLVANGRATGAPTVAERLHAAGWATGAFVTAHVLDRHAGLDRGFEHYDDRWGWGQRLGWHPLAEPLDWPRRGLRRPGDEAVDRALAWLAAQDRPALLWVHLYDAHAPYRPPAGFAPEPEALEAARAADKSRRRELRGLDLLTRARVGRAEELRLQYAAAAAWTDHLLGRLVAGLPAGAKGVVVADHGEGLGEHGEWFNHGGALWETTMRVPMASFGVEPPREEPGLVSVAAVHDLLLAAAGLGAVPAPVGGVRQYTTGQQAELSIGQLRRRDRAAAALRVDRATLLAPPGEAPAWYDLAADPDQATPLPVPAERAADAAAIEALRARATPELSKEEAERLRALGYVE